MIRESGIKPHHACHDHIGRVTMGQGKIFNWAGVEPWPSNHSGVAEKVVTGKNMQLIRAEL